MKERLNFRGRGGRRHLPRELALRHGQRRHALRPARPGCTNSPRGASSPRSASRSTPGSKSRSRPNPTRRPKGPTSSFSSTTSNPTARASAGRHELGEMGTGRCVATPIPVNNPIFSRSSLGLAVGYWQHFHIFTISIGPCAGARGCAIIKPCNRSPLTTSH